MTFDEYDTGHDILGAIMTGEAKPSWQTQDVSCEWFDKTKPTRRKFHQDMLELVTE